MAMEIELDCMGTLCPTPIIRLGKAIKEIESGDSIILKADDPATENDLIAWARLTGNASFSLSQHKFRITKN